MNDLVEAATDRVCHTVKMYVMAEEADALTPELDRMLRDAVFNDVMLIARAGKG